MKREPILVLAVASAMWSAACCSTAPATKPAGPTDRAPAEVPMQSTGPTTIDPLVGKLVSGAYGDLFNYAVREGVVDAVWAEPDSQARLEAIARDHGAPLAARFRACEVLYDKHFSFVATVGGPAVADIYAQALAHDLTGVANSWGLLYEHDDEGPVGIRFVMLGDDAVPALLGLLDDDRQLLSYAGGEEATIGNAYRFRIKDYAAFYLGKIKGVRIAFHPRLEDRDRAIADLARAVQPAP